MDGVVYKNFGSTEQLRDGIYPLFGFAVGDYLKTYNIPAESAVDYRIFGAVLYSHDVNNDLFQLLKHLIRNNSSLALMVFDIDTLEKEDCDSLMENLDGAYGFTELKDVYEDRIVFARKV